MNNRTLLLVGAVLGLGLPTQVASACPAPARGVRGSPFITSDGTLQFRWTCYESTPCPADAAPSFVVVDSEQHELAGSVVKFGHEGTGQAWIAWRPTQPFLSGQTYQVGVTTDAGIEGIPFSLDTQISVDPSTLAFKFNAGKSTIAAGDSACCAVRPPYACGTGPSCFASKRQEVVRLQVVSNAASGDSFQWLYRVRFLVDGTSMAQPDATALAAVLELQTVASQYCVSIDAVDPVSGDVTHVGDGCQPYVDGELALRALNDDELRSELGGCASPPPGFESEWERLIVPHDAGVANHADASFAPDAALHTLNDAGASSSAGDQAVQAAHPHDGGGCAVARRFDAGSLLALLMLVLRARKKQHV